MAGAALPDPSKPVGPLIRHACHSRGAERPWRGASLGRQWLILMLGAPFILPTLVAILGLIAVFGQRGLLNGSSNLSGI